MLNFAQSAAEDHGAEHRATAGSSAGTAQPQLIRAGTLRVVETDTKHKPTWFIAHHWHKVKLHWQGLNHRR